MNLQGVEILKAQADKRATTEQIRRYLQEVGRVSREFNKRYVRSNKVKPPKLPSDPSYKRGYTTRLIETGRGVRSIDYRVFRNKVLVGTPVKYMAINRKRGYEFLFILNDNKRKAEDLDRKLKKHFFDFTGGE